MTNNYQKYRSSLSNLPATTQSSNPRCNAFISASFTGYLKHAPYAPSRASSSSPFSTVSDDIIYNEHDSHTPVCSDNEEEPECDEHLDAHSDVDCLPKSASPGYKKWYMAFPSNNNKHQTELDLLSSFNIGTDFCVENLQPQQTDIFCSTAYRKNMSNNINANHLQHDQDEGNSNDSKHDKDIHDESSAMVRDGDAITMMGCIHESNCSLKFNLDIPSKWQSKIYSEGNIGMNRGNETEPEFDEENIIHEEGTNDTQSTQTDDEQDDDEDDDLLQSKGFTLMGPIHTNDEYETYEHGNEQKEVDEQEEEEDEDEDDDIVQAKGVTLMGQLDISHQIQFGMQSSMKDKELPEIGKQNVNVTLMGYFESERSESEQHLSFSNRKGIVMMNGRHNKMVVFNASVDDDDENDQDSKQQQ